MSKNSPLTPSIFKCPDNLHTRVHSKKLDDSFGFRISDCEALICKDETDFNSWIGLEPEILQTPYSEIYTYFTILKNYNIDKIIDYGAAYGRVGIVSSSFFKDSKFLGYEVLKERALEGNRVFKDLAIPFAHIHTTNILSPDFIIEPADIYFIYDFSDPAQQKILLDKISDKVFKDKFFIIARGKGIRSLIQNKYPQFYSLHNPVHLETASIYSSFTDLS